MQLTKLYSLIVCGILLCTVAPAQQRKPAATHAPAKRIRPDTTYIKPSFPGGQPALDSYFAKTLLYPDEAYDAGVQGRVAVTFIIDDSGKVRNPRLTRGIGAGCDEVALRAVATMPRWIPGRYGNKPTRMMYVLPLTFKLE